MFWQPDSYPICTHHVFLSHSREDHDALVRPVYDGLREKGVIGWLDREAYTYGRDSRTALKCAVLESRHVVFFVTPAMIASGRGWCVFELAYVELLQAALVRPGGALANLFLPLYFVPQSDPALPRTVWQAPRDRGRFHDPAADGPPGPWAVREVVRFLRTEERLAADFRSRARADREFKTELRKKRGLFDRACRFDPQPLPVVEPE